MPIKGAALWRIHRREIKPKVLSGCEACRTRDINCDETKPQCRNCSIIGQICKEYRHSPNPSSESPSVPSSTPRQFLSIAAAPQPNLFTSDQEHRSFTFFCQYTVPQISSTYSDEFWNRLVLQATHHEPAIRHAAIALGSLHEKFTLRDGVLGGAEMKSEDDSFALEQYVKALGSLLEPAKGKGKQAADVALMTCVLFICFETLRGHHGAALAHVDAGIKIISELSSTRTSSTSSTSNLSISSTPYTPLSTLNRIFIRLETQAATITFGRKRQLISSAYDFGPDGFKEDIPRTFASIEEARSSLEYIRTIGARAIPSKPISIPPTGLEAAKMQVAIELIRTITAIRLRQWSSAFESFLLTNTNKLDETNRQSIALSKIHKLLIGVSYKVDLYRALNDEMVWDEFSSEYEAIISHAAEIITSPNQAQRAMIFNLETGIIIPLYFVAGKCRDYRVRRRAIELLRASGRQEGVSNSEFTARVAERLVEIEEEGLLDREGERGGAENVPRGQRVAWVEIEFEGQEQRARLRYRRNDVEETAVEEWVEW